MQSTEETAPIRLIRARQLLCPVLGRLDDAAVVVAEGRVREAGPWREVRRGVAGPLQAVEEIDATLAPGLVNAHVHLEISHLRGRTVLGRGYEAWVRSLIAIPPEPAPAESLASAVAELRASGTAGLADISTRWPDLVSGCLEEAGLEYVLFSEAIGFQGPEGAPAGPPPRAALVPKARLAMAGHALYSTGPAALRAAKEWDVRHGRPFTLHLAEHPQEGEFLRTGGGSFGALLRERLVPPDFTPPGLGSVAYARSLGLLDSGTLAVHCVHVDDEDIDLLALSGATVCLCPRSNEAIGVGRAPWERLAAARIPLCLGTDSLASNSDLDLWNEARYLLGRWPGLRLVQVLAMMTLHPARVLGFSGLGRLTPGAVAAFCRAPDDLPVD